MNKYTKKTQRYARKYKFTLILNLFIYLSKIETLG